MTSETEPVNPTDLESRRRAILISKCNLGSGQLERILRHAQNHATEFGEAAVTLKIITQQELEDAYALADARDNSTTVTLIEKALRKLSGAKQYQTSSQTLVSHKVRPAKSLALVHDPYNDRSEKLRALATELMLLTGTSNKGSVITLVSPQNGEGRSQLAAELAIAFAQLDRNTLLVDADIRQPRQHNLFEGADERGGLAHALAEGTDPNLHAVEGVDHLHLLVAGEKPSNPLELLSSSYFKKLVGLWRRQYDFVIIDTPPISQYADGLATVTVGGNALLVSRAQHSQYKDTKEMLRRLAATQSQILGAVINYF